VVDDPAVGPRHPTRTLGVIGWPVSASLSPTIHNAAFRALGLDWTYVPLPVRPDALAEALRGLAALGFAGANVTMPHKTEAADLVDLRSEEAEILRSVNTVVVTPDGLEGHNTDAPGFDRFLREDLAFDPAGRSVLLYGAGGAARACAVALARAGAARIAVAVRDVARATDVARLADDVADRLEVLAFEEAPAESPDLVVNATPVGRAGEALPLPPLGPGMLVVDLLYRPAVTPLQETARAAGAIATNGLGLLLHQAGLAFERWTGQVPPLDVMSAAAVAALADRPL
jgi:shikimate dehydrogenase